MRQKRIWGSFWGEMCPDSAQRCALWIVLYCSLASLAGARGLCERCKTNVTVPVRVNGEVLLSCVFAEDDPKRSVTGGDEKILWTHISRGPVLEMTRTGDVNFSDPREGRVKAFPYLCRLGNCSIYIEQLQQSDLGKYCCTLRNRSVCSVVKFRGEPNELEHITEDKWFAIGGGAGGIFFVLLISVFCYVKFRKRDEHVPDETNTGVHQDAGSDAEDIIYENDEHDPNGIACVEIKPQEEVTSSSGSTGQQPRPVKPYYANQEEIDKQLKKKKKLQKKQLQYENPIYANSNEKLDRS